MPTPSTGTPRYRQVAAELGRRIEAGVIPAGSLLPAESALVREFGISRGTAREAIAALRSEGLVVTEHGRGTYARPQHQIRRLGHDRYRWDRLGTMPEGAQVDAQTEDVAATPALARLFEVEPGTRLTKHQSVLRSNGVPQQFITSYYLRDISPQSQHNASNRPLTEPVVELSSVRTAVTTIREVVRARMPTIKEIELLRLSPGIPVLAIMRRSYANRRVVEIAQDIVLPSDRTEVEYEIGLDP